MNRKMYQPTEKQEQKWSEFYFAPLPTDEQFKASWAKAHHGKINGWGIGKRQWIISNLAGCREYQMGLWQARADFIRGLDYQDKLVDDENANAYNLGYYRGWNDGRPLAGIDKGTVARLQSEYGEEN